MFERHVFDLWPSRSLDLNPIDIYLWDNLYGTEVNDTAELRDKKNVS